MSKRRIMAGFRPLPPQIETEPEVTLPEPEPQLRGGLIVDGTIRIGSQTTVVSARGMQVFDADGNLRLSVGVF